MALVQWCCGAFYFLAVHRQPSKYMEGYLHLVKDIVQHILPHFWGGARIAIFFSSFSRIKNISYE